MFTVHVHHPQPDGAFGKGYRLRTVSSVLFVYIDHNPDADHPRLCVCRVNTEQMYQTLVLELMDQPLWYGAAAIFHVIGDEDIVMAQVRYRLADPRTGWRVPSFQDHAFFTPYAERALQNIPGGEILDHETVVYPAPIDEVSIYVS